jgi:hypothetical protein
MFSGKRAFPHLLGRYARPAAHHRREVMAATQASQITGQRETPFALTEKENLTEEQIVEQTTADIEAALADIDSNDTTALYARCEQIVDDIHSGRF